MLDLAFSGSIARSATCRYLSYPEADFEVFAPQGRHVAPMGVRFGTGADFTRRRLSVCLFVCLSVSLSVTLLNVRVCAPDFAMKALEYRNDFDAVGYRKVCSYAPVLKFEVSQTAANWRHH